MDTLSEEEFSTAPEARNQTKRGSVSRRTIVVIAFSILIIEAVILGFSAASQRETLLNHYIFEASIVAKTLSSSDDLGEGALQAAAESLREEQVLAIRSAEGATSEDPWNQSAYGGQYREGPEGLVYRLHGLEIQIDTSAIPGELRAYAVRILGLTDISGSEADLTERLPVGRSDEIGRISERFNDFSEQLRSIVIAIQERSRELSTRIDHLSALSQNTGSNVLANRELVQGMRDGLASLDQSLQEVAPSVRNITGSINALVESVQRQSDAVNESTAAVEEMDASIRSLDGIAKEKKESTDSLVSLAEEAGKGFAVVADEIRKLSELSAENAGKINSSLRKDIDEIHRAGEINRSTLDVFEKIVGSVREMARSMGEMLAGLNEQSIASSDIVQSLSSIREVSDTVSSESGRIQSEAEAINKTIERLAGSSRQVASSADEVTERIASNADSTSKIDTIVQSATEEIRELEKQVARFRTGAR